MAQTHVPMENRAGVDPVAFAAMLEDVEANMDGIWLQLEKIVRDASKGITIRRPMDIKELRGDALTFAIEQIDKYDPRKGSAYHFFHTMVRRKMKDYAKKIQPFVLSSCNLAVSLHEMYDFEDAMESRMRLSRENCPNNWKSFIVHGEDDLNRVKKCVAEFLTSGRKRYEESDSDGEREGIKWMIEGVLQCGRALTGERMPHPIPLAKAG